MKILREYVAAVHLLAGLVVTVLVAGLLPGDHFDVNTVGAVAMIVMALFADAILTGPAYLYARSRGVALAPFKS